ncbi:MAG: aminoacetone oxidase family FAD-binding enzyme [Acidobacteriota bacterium]
MKTFDVAVVGAGAAGLMAAIFAGRAGARVIALDSAPKIGAKILISGGGRCNVTHDMVTAADFNGSRNAIAKVLRTFDVPETVAFFESLGVRLKREETGKLFPMSDRARDVVEALLRAAADAGVEIVTAARVLAVGSSPFAVETANGQRLTANRVVLAAGGKSVPKTGSDGSGYALARALGHTVTKTFPALVPLVVLRDHWITALSGTSVDAELSVKSPTGRVLHRERGSMLFTHFGISGPVVLDISRHWIANQPATLAANFLPGETFDSLDAAFIAGTPAAVLRRRLPDRLAAQLAPPGRLTKEARRQVVHDVVDFTIPVVRDRGFDYAEVTAGGVPLSEVEVSTMASRVREGLYLCGEILDVDGKIGGYNFQWAWASGRLAGIAAATNAPA